MDHIKLNIGDIRFKINWEGSQVTNWPAGIYNNFISPDAGEDIILSVKCGDLPEYNRGEMIFDAGFNWKLYKNSNGYTIEEFDVTTHKMDRIIMMNNDLSNGDIYITPNIEPKKNGGKKWDIHRVTDPLMKLLVANILPVKNGVLLHALGVSDKGKGMLFIGQSGAGKSTLANFYKGYKGVTILNDERLIILYKDNSFFLKGSPWPGDSMISSPVSVPIHNIFFIKHSHVNKIEEIFAAKSVQRIFQQVFLPFWNPKAIDSTLKFCERLTKKITPFELGFVKDKGVVSFIRGQLNSSPKG